MADHEINHDERFLFLTWWFGCPSNRKVEEWVMEQFWKKLKGFNSLWAPTMRKYSRSSSTFLSSSVINTWQQQRSTINTQCSQMVATLRGTVADDFLYVDQNCLNIWPLLLHEITLWAPGGKCEIFFFFRERINYKQFLSVFFCVTFPKCTGRTEKNWTIFSSFNPLPSQPSAVN